MNVPETKRSEVIIVSDKIYELCKKCMIKNTGMILTIEQICEICNSIYHSRVDNELTPVYYIEKSCPYFLEHLLL